MLVIFMIPHDEALDALIFLLSSLGALYIHLRPHVLFNYLQKQQTNI